MIGFIREILLSITVISIFSGIVLKISSDNEIVKIGCSMLMIIAIIVPFKRDLDFNSLAIDFQSEAYQISDVSSIELDLIEQSLEEYLFENGNISAEITIDNQYNIEKVIAQNQDDIQKISELLGINEQKIEYIKSR